MSGLLPLKSGKILWAKQVLTSGKLFILEKELVHGLRHASN